MSDCVFCRIRDKEIPSEFLYEDDEAFVIKDINPLAPVHLLLISKKHIASLQQSSAEENALFGHMLALARQLAPQFGLADTGYRVVTNIGSHGGQTVKHLHFHILGGSELGGFGI